MSNIENFCRERESERERMKEKENLARKINLLTQLCLILDTLRYLLFIYT